MKRRPAFTSIAGAALLLLLAVGAWLAWGRGPGNARAALCPPVGSFPAVTGANRAHYGRADAALSRPDLEETRDQLARAITSAGDKEEAARAYAAKLLVDVAALAAAVHMADEYRLLIDQMPPDAASYENAVALGKAWISRANRQLDRLSVQGEDFRQNFYRRDIAWVSPLRARVRPDEAAPEVEEALSMLRGGDVDSVVEGRIAAGVYRAGLAAVFGEAVRQPECAAGEVFLGGTLDVAALLWDVGSKLNDADLARWYLEEIVAVTDDRPEDPIRRRAQEALASEF